MEMSKQSTLNKFAFEIEASHQKLRAVEKAATELTDEELTERLRLERKVERGFYEAGKSLARIRDLELYRDRWRSFEAYVKDRFGWQRAHAYRQITAANIFDELADGSSPNWKQLPTCESQIRPLAELKPEHRKEVWKYAVEDNNGRVPTQAIVKKAVIDFQHTYLTDDKNPYAIDDIVSVKGKKGWWIVLDICTYSNCYCKNYCDDTEISTFDLEPVVLDDILKVAAAKLIERLSDLWWRSEHAPTADAIAIKGLVKAIATNPQATLSEAQSQLLDLAEILLQPDK